ncbi:hypothetical protein APS56_13660 [Pseudalgibacter alginicilyticus]|uniref:Uncharacterized protein n=1 Tax=Pseudalgibacter alginicilyticus TaxID=1736674 RepID=A0A0N7HYT0_9FLAO|nr:DUF6090 family protein [Pseudalgibacter alginicilyticus]ALJ06110.1 hypothetical protein APS56_13660 [Pseudalgibacter alginicilyticus]
MIKFFRNIRKKSLTKNKISKYLIYAIGEIVLVVIGILIALQISTWNIEYKRDTQEYKILIEMHKNLKTDSIEWPVI